MRKKFCLTSLLACILFNVFSQSHASEIVFSVQLKPGTNPQILAERAIEDHISLIQYTSLVPNARIFNFHFDQNVTNIDIRTWLISQKEVSSFQKVVPMTPRSCDPNDSAYSSQYSLDLMQFDETWCYGTTGLSPEGDTLAIGVIDFGFAFSQEDLLPNIYFNPGETPDNSLDDDQNGYTDDYYGFNARVSPPGDNHSSETHGTQVISVIGAKGNNRKGISGTNQNIKILLCSAVTSDQLLVCYYYFVKMKRTYLNSNGQKGLYLVGSNLSAGFDRQFPEDLPLICQVYDSLGKVGILNSVATVNENENIDTFGDIPGLCPSEYLITVTNTNRFDQKVPEAGFSALNVDLGASGQEILMIDRDGTLREESGCSFSSPHVAGAIPLLSQFCPKLTQLAKSKPADASLLLKSFILNQGDPVGELKGITVSGKRLNVLRSLESLNNYCSQDSVLHPEIGLRPNIGAGLFTLNFRPGTFGSYELQLCNSLGQILHTETLIYKPDAPLQRDFDFTNWSSGIYHLFIKGNSFEFAESFVKW